MNIPAVGLLCRRQRLGQLEPVFRPMCYHILHSLGGWTCKQMMAVALWWRFLLEALYSSVLPFTRKLSQVANGKKDSLQKKKYCRTKPKQFFRRCDYLRKITDKARQSLRVVVDIEVSPQVAACATTKLFTTCAHFQFVWFLSISCYTCVDWTQYNSPIFSEWHNSVCQGFWAMPS